MPSTDHPAAPAVRGPSPAQAHRRLVAGLVAAVAVLGIVALTVAALDRPTPTPTTLADRIVTVANSQLGYTTAPADTYCNRYSAFWHAGKANCGNDNRREQWCADFAAWVWRKAGALVVYRLHPGDLNSASASFYLWGVAHGTWHPVGSHYVAKPGDVAVYGLQVRQLVADHVAVVTGTTAGDKGPNVVNGDGSRTGFSVVETGHDQLTADVHGGGGRLSGYVSPTAAPKN